MSEKVQAVAIVHQITVGLANIAATFIGRRSTSAK